MTKIDQAAQALYETEPFGDAGGPIPWGRVHESQKEGFRIKAHAVVEALREPTGVMNAAVEDMLEEDNMYMDCSSTSVWQAMIDAILKDTP